MLLHDSERRWKVQFDSLAELSSWIERTPKTWRQNSSAQEPFNRGWCPHDFEQTKRVARDGWPEGIKSVLALSATVPNAQLTTKTYCIAGEYPDVPRAVVGDPFNMVRRGKDRTPRPTMTIALNTRISCAVGSKEAENFGAAIVALVDRLENRGIRVELLGLMATDNPERKKRWCVSWTVKETGEHLDLNAVAFSYAHPGMFRRLGFAVMERSPAAMEHYGYGMNGGISEDDFINISPGALLINGVDHNPGACKTMKSALEFAKDQINAAAKKLGMPPIAELEEL